MYCRVCRYDLRGLESRRCPECDTSFDPERRSTYRTTQHDPHRYLVACVVWLAIVFFGVATITVAAPGGLLAGVFDSSKPSVWRILGFAATSTAGIASFTIPFVLIAVYVFQGRPPREGGDTEIEHSDDELFHRR